MHTLVLREIWDCIFVFGMAFVQKQVLSESVPEFWHQEIYKYLTIPKWEGENYVEFLFISKSSLST